MCEAGGGGCPVKRIEPFTEGPLKLITFMRSKVLDVDLAPIF